MLRKDIDKLFTEKAMLYFNNGYVLNTKTLNRKELDLIKGNHFIRVFIEEKTERNYAEQFEADTICVSVAETTFEHKWQYEKDLIWTSNLKIIEENVFYEVGRRNHAYVSREESVKIQNIIAERWNRKRRNDRINYDIQKYGKVLLPLIKREKGYKTVKLSDIKKIEKVKTYGKYTILVSFNSNKNLQFNLTK